MSNEKLIKRFASSPEQLAALARLASELEQIGTDIKPENLASVWNAVETYKGVKGSRPNDD